MHGEEAHEIDPDIRKVGKLVETSSSRVHIMAEPVPFHEDASRCFPLPSQLQRPQSSPGVEERVPVEQGGDTMNLGKVTVQLDCQRDHSTNCLKEKYGKAKT